MPGEAVQFALSLMAVAALVGIAHLAGFTAPAALQSADEARELVRLAPGGFTAQVLAIDRAGRGALAEAGDGRLLLLRPLGARFVPEIVTRSRVRREGEVLWVETGPGAATMLDIGPDAARWA